MDNNKVKVTLKIFRYNPEADRKSHYDTYELEVERTERVLDMLEYVKGYYDGTLSFRRSCAHGICGSDAMRINGRNYLACKAFVQQVVICMTRANNQVRWVVVLGIPIRVVNDRPRWQPPTNRAFYDGDVGKDFAPVHRVDFVAAGVR